ncbi:hypothetical protein ACHHYP_00692 [Achlya hypogyna]|uniref:DUF4042 domain-containing protein n=1 Tax=Achlya hypogyna TaxID=1202772 RepID=A0A1V9ZU51_ACHHY|nr:hypothetical protein ACHHYP_00692 [Achlya hypogyna]
MWQASRSASRPWAQVRAKLAPGTPLLSSAELDALLAHVTTLPLPPPRLRTEEVGGTVAALAAVLPPHNELLVADFMQLFSHCCKEKLVLAPAHVDSILSYCMAALQQCPSWYAEQTLVAIAQLLADNADRCKDRHDAIFTALAQYLDPTSADDGARFAATQCMAHVLAGVSDTPPPFAAALWTTTVDNFMQQCRRLANDAAGIRCTMDRVLYKTCMASMDCLLALVAVKEAPALESAVFLQLPKVLACLRQLLGRRVVSLRAHALVGCGLELLDRAVADSDAESASRGRYAQHLSGVSPPGSGLAARLRLAVVKLLDAVLCAHSPSVTMELGLYLPEAPSPRLLLFKGAPSLLSLVVADPSELVRLEVLRLLEHLWPLLNPRPLLALAAPPAAATFTSRSTSVLLMALRTHVALLAVVRADADAGVLVQALKTLTALAQHCPYAHMVAVLATATPPLADVVTGLLGHLHALLFASDHAVRVAALASLSGLLSTTEPFPTVLQWLEGPPTRLVPRPGIAPRKAVFLAEMLGHAKAADASPFHRLDAMALLSKVAKSYAPALSQHWPRLAEFLLAAFRDVDQNVRLQAVKILENYIKGEPGQNLYLPFLTTNLVRAFQDPSHHVRASVCACFTLLREGDWVSLPPDAFAPKFLATPLDPSPVVRAAGFRLLGALALLPPFKTPAFVSRVVCEGMRLAADPTLNVRVRVVWAIGNACTTPGPDSTEAQDTPWLIALLEPELLFRVLECMLALVDDNDKVASSVVRTMGLVARWLCAAPYLSQVARAGLALSPTHLLMTTMESLARKIGDGAPKVRWNSCHALAKIFQSPELPVASAPWTPTVFTALLAAIAQQDNFKVRISAAMALRVSLSRASYGLFYERIVQTIVDALDTVVELKDIKEFKYKAQLELQLSFTLLHLVAVATPDDEALLGAVLARQYKDFVYDWLYQQQHKIYAAIFGNEVDDEPPAVEEGHEVNPLSCTQVVEACDVLLRVVRAYCPHTAACLGQINEIKLIFGMDLSKIGFEF